MEKPLLDKQQKRDGLNVPHLNLISNTMKGFRLFPCLFSPLQTEFSEWEREEKRQRKGRETRITLKINAGKSRTDQLPRLLPVERYRPTLAPLLPCSLPFLTDRCQKRKTGEYIAMMTYGKNGIFDNQDQLFKRQRGKER